MWRLGACNDYSLPFMTVLLSWLCYDNDVICSAASSLFRYSRRVTRS